MSADAKKFLFGGLSCQFATLFTNPVDVVKTRMQLSGELSSANEAIAAATAKRPGLIAVAQALAANEGPRAFYRGITASILRVALYSSTRMGLYEPFKELLAPGVTASNTSLYVRIAAGGAAGAIGALVSNPTDLVRVRMQVRPRAHAAAVFVAGARVTFRCHRPTPRHHSTGTKAPCMRSRPSLSLKAYAACGKGLFPTCSGLQF
jgi:hypothetical protein